MLCDFITYGSNSTFINDTVLPGTIANGTSFVGGITSYVNASIITSINVTICGTLSGKNYVGGIYGYVNAISNLSI